MNKSELNGWQNIGRLYQWLQNQKLNPNEVSIYMTIAQESVGYCNSTTPLLSYLDIESKVNKGRKAIGLTINNLIDQKFIIKVPTNKGAWSGKLAGKYKINFLLDNFPYLTINSKANIKKEIKRIEIKIADLALNGFAHIDEYKDLEKELNTLKETE